MAGRGWPRLPGPRNECRAQQRQHTDFFSSHASSDQRIRARLERCAERILGMNLGDESAMSATGAGQARQPSLVLRVPCKASTPPLPASQGRCKLSRAEMMFIMLYRILRTQLRSGEADCNPDRFRQSTHRLSALSMVLMERFCQPSVFHSNQMKCLVIASWMRTGRGAAEMKGEEVEQSPFPSS